MVARIVGFSEELNINEDSISFRVWCKASSRRGKEKAGAAGEKGLRCCKAHARGRASDGDDFAGERDHRAVETVETCVAMSLGILKTEL